MVVTRIRELMLVSLMTSPDKSECGDAKEQAEFSMNIKHPSADSFCQNYLGTLFDTMSIYYYTEYPSVVKSDGILVGLSLCAVSPHRVRTTKMSQVNAMFTRHSRDP